MIYSTKESRIESLFRKISNSVKEIEEAVGKLEKAQLSCEGTTSDLISKTETVKCIIGESCMDIGDADFSMKCAKCGAEYYHVEDYDYEYNFCPNCGRRWRRQDG